MHTLGLADARERALELRQQIKAGIDPLDAKRELKAARLANRAQRAKAVTFAQCAEMYLDVHADRWKNPKHRAQWRSTLATLRLPGHRRPGRRRRRRIRICSKCCSRSGSEFPRRRRGCGRESKTSWATRPRAGSATATIRRGGAVILKTLLGGAPKEVEHHPALPFLDAPIFVAELRGRQSTSARALEFLVLTAARTSEVIGAHWAEINHQRQDVDRSRPGA